MNTFSKEFLYAVKKAGGKAQIHLSGSSTSDASTWFITKKGDLYGTGKAYAQGKGSNYPDVLTFTKRASGVKQVWGSNSATLYLTENGDLYGTGAGVPLGSGAYNTGTTYNFIKLASDVAFVITEGDATGSTGYIKTNGDFYLCGSRSYGQQGDGQKGYTYITFTKRASNVKQVEMSGYTTYYVTEDGDLYATGYNTYGQQGSGTSGNNTETTTFTKRASNVDYVLCDHNSGGYNYCTWYVTNNGDLYGCGYGYQGQQGNGITGSNANVKTFTKRASNVVQVACSASTTWYIDTNGDLYGCGAGGNGQQGSGGTSDVTTFTKRASNVAYIKCSDYLTYYLDNNGDLYGCGNSNSGQQGNDSTNNVLTFENKMQYLTA